MSVAVTVVPYVLAFLTREKIVDGHVQQEVLLLYRTGTGFGNDHYSMPGGKVDVKESLLKAIIREVYEEVGVTVVPEDTQLSHVMHFQGATKLCVAFVFTINHWQGEPFNKEPEKHNHIKWFDVNDLPTTILPRHGKMIQSIEQGLLYADEGL